MKLLVPTVICWLLLPLLDTAHGAENLKTYQPPRLPDGHVDMQGIWKNSNLSPLERPEGLTRLTISAADAKRLESQYYLASAAPINPTIRA